MIATRLGVVAALLAAVVSAPGLMAQRGRGGPPAAAPTPRAIAPTDLAGTWVSVITEDWRMRMTTPRKGERAGIPLNAAGVAATNAWDPDKDTAAGEECRAFGAPGVMRAPGKLRIAWADDNTLKIDAEAGTQTRLLHFSATSADMAPSWQGRSAAEWQFAGGRRGRGAPAGGSLKVVTTRLRPGYLQKNGVPYGANAVLSEYFSRTTEPNGDSWIVLTAIVEDAQYLNQPFIRSSHFKKVADTSVWEPESCSAK